MAKMEKTEMRAKLFRNGGSQAVRLPKEFQFMGTEVRVRRSGNGVLLEPELAAMMDEAMRKLQEGGGSK